MEFEKQIFWYNKFNQITNEKSETFFINKDVYEENLKSNVDYSRVNSKFYTNYKNILNTTNIADAITSRNARNSEGFYPELAMMFLKTYTKTLLTDNYNSLNSNNLITVFNKNQELVEIPYPIVLLLGGLYYFQENQILINKELGTKHFSTINDVKVNTNQRSNVDYYDLNSLKEIDDGKIFTNKVKSELTYPSTRVLNRSVYVSNSDQFDIKVGVNGDEEIITKININSKQIMPPIGYGIQNKFLNEYNKLLFGDYLNGSTTTKHNSNKPHVIVGGYSGILKPIKTYNSDIEFTAFYRNPYVGSYNFNPNDLKVELESAIDILGGKMIFSNANSLNQYYDFLTKSFLVYSKLKAAYLSNQFGSDDKFKEVIGKLCEVKKLKNKYNETTRLESVGDFYFLISHIFFSSFKQSLNNGKDYSLINRLNFGFENSQEYLIRITGNGLNDNLPHNTTLFNNVVRTKDEVGVLFNFFTEIWGLEKLNLKENYAKVDRKASFTLYPSAGGFITPNRLITANENGVINNLGVIINDENKYILKNTGDRNSDFTGGRGFGQSTFRNLNVNQTTRVTTFKESESKKVFLERKNKRTPLVEKYIVTQDLNNTNQFKYSNYSILRNTTRFLWFEDTKLGGDLTLDEDYTSKNEEESISFLKDIFNIQTSEINGGFVGYHKDTDAFVENIKDIKTSDNYLTNITNTLFNIDDTKILRKTDYYDIFSFNRLLDTINVEKLEEFQNIFIDFSDFNTKNKINNTYNLNSLVKASSTLKINEMFANTNGVYTDQETNLALTNDDVALLLIGNSMFNYDFIAESRINIFLNIALTSGQKKKCEEVVTQFCGRNVTIANKSTIDSVGKIPDSDFQLSIHNFHNSPEVLFTNVNTYSELKEKIEPQNMSGNVNSFNRTVTRRILFGNQVVQSYNGVDEDEVRNLNKLFLINKLHHINFDVTTQFNDYYLFLVKSFFKYLNLKYSKGNYKQLLKLIRSYCRFISKSDGIQGTQRNPKLKDDFINEKFFTNLGVIPFDEFQNKLGVPQSQSERETILRKRISLIGEFDFYNPSLIEGVLTNNFFENFNKETFESIVGNSNSFLNQINQFTRNILSSGNANDLIDKNDERNYLNDLKRSTYYNIKSIFDKTSSSVVDESLFGDVDLLNKDDFNKLNITNIINNKLFFNYVLNSEDCNTPNLDGEDSMYDLYQIFQVVDRGNNDIGSKSLVNLTFLYDNLYSEFLTNPTTTLEQNNLNSVFNLTSGSVYKLFDGLARTQGFLLQQIPNYLNLNSAISRIDSDDESVYEVVDDLFGVHTTTELFGTNLKSKRGVNFGGLFGFPGYIFQLGTSETTLNTNDGVVQAIKNDTLNSFCLDIGYNDNREIVVKDESAPEDILKSNITCFTVDFGIKNQQMFNDIQLDTNEFNDTEESIRNWVDVLNNVQSTQQSTNLFPILEKRQYSATIGGMGNATIQPLTYFFLRNVPLFYGTYWITNVMHSITPNNMGTVFKGTRQPIAVKSDTRREILRQFKKSIENLRERNTDANVIITEEIPITVGDIFNINSTSLPYGEVIQQYNTVDRYFNFTGIEIIGYYVVSVTNSNTITPTNVGIITSLYNQSSALLSNTENHTNIIANMKNIAIGIMREKSQNGDVRYSINNELSLSTLFKNNELSVTGELFLALSDIAKSKQNYDTFISNISSNEGVKSFKAINSGATTLVNDNTDIKFELQDNVYERTGDGENRQWVLLDNDKSFKLIQSKKLLKQATFFIETTEVKKPQDKLKGLGILRGGTQSDLGSVYEVFDGLKWESGNNPPAGINNFIGSIQKINLGYTIQRQPTFVPIQLPNFSDFSTSTPERPTTKKIIDVKFLGAFDSGVSFFSGRGDVNKPWGYIIWDNVTKKTFNLENATSEQLLNRLLPTEPVFVVSGISENVDRNRIYPPIVRTIISNGADNGNVNNKGNIKIKSISNINGVTNFKKNAKFDEDKIIVEAADALEVMLNDFVKYAKESNFKTDKNGNYVNINSLYRTIEKQTELYNNNVKNNNGKPTGAVAKPGISNHSWGIAVDLTFIAQKDGNVSKLGELIRNRARFNYVKEGFDKEINPSCHWFLNNGWKYGFVIPWGLRGAGKTFEFWHFEYHGTAALCMMKKNPSIVFDNVKKFEFVTPINETQNKIVLNPIDKNGKRPIYNNCNYLKPNQGDGSE